MQKLYCLSLLIFVLLTTGISAQNAIEVSNFQSPLPIHYQSNATEPIRIFVVNKGPNFLMANDSFYFDYTISANDTTLFFSKTLSVGRFLNVDEGNAYTLDSAYRFPDNYYSICAGIRGSRDYPSNTAKFHSACMRLTVGLDENTLRVNTLFYSQGQIHYSIENADNPRLQFFDLQGKLLFQKELKSKNGQLNFKAKTGLYLIRLFNDQGQSISEKLFIH